MKNFVESNIKKLAFQFARNTVLKDLPDHVKNGLFEQVMDGCKNQEIPFLHSKVNGLIFPAFMSEKKLRDCTTFKTRPGDVFLVTYPKSGTVWITEIVRQLNKLKNSCKEDIVDVKVSRFEVENHKQIEALPSPRYITTHLPFALVPRSSKRDVKYIYLARNPRDVAVSFFYFMRQMPLLRFDGTWEEFLEYFMKGDVPYGSYFDHVLEWWSHQDDENVLFLQYEELKKDLKVQVKIIAEFLGLKLSDEEAKAVAEKCTFQAMKSNPNLDMNKIPPKLLKIVKIDSHFRKGIVGDWKNHFSDEQLEAFDELSQSRINETGLEFEF